MVSMTRRKRQTFSQKVPPGWLSVMAASGAMSAKVAFGLRAP